MASTFRYREYLEDGTDLDDYVTGPTPWRPGDTLYVDGRPAYRITEVIRSRTSTSTTGSSRSSLWVTRSATTGDIPESVRAADEQHTG
jgi:hypothetical protein